MGLWDLVFRFPLILPPPRRFEYLDRMVGSPSSKIPTTSFGGSAGGGVEPAERGQAKV